jgi:plastocyanin
MLLAVDVCAQAPGTGAIVGTVRDPSGLAVGNAVVSAIDESTNLTRSAATNTAGVFKMPLLLPGSYSITVNAPGFAESALKSVGVVVGETSSVEFKLAIKSVNVSLAVTADAEIVQAQTSTLGRAVLQDSVNSLPLSSRNYTQILSLSPGVVVARVTMQAKAGAGASAQKDSPSLAGVVIWLTPMQPDSRPASTGHPGPFRLVQKDKMFTPHIQVVPTGSSVDFPNEDPFFHNVFSLFNGKRFDLGLYESGTSRAVHFDREGVSYIFCNIHPEMGAVVLALSTPYFAISSASGVVEIHDVPPGNYHLHVWSEAAKSSNPSDKERVVQVEAAPVHLGNIAMEGAADPMQSHKNKFGEDYRPSRNSPY